MEYRTEKDNIGEYEVPIDSYYGIHTQRSINNFRISNYKVPSRLYRALALVKKAAALTNYELGYLEKDSAFAIFQACDEINSGKLMEYLETDAFQGGAGTSTNMNINEVIANRALDILGYDKGAYHIIHPIEQINLHQSTNDVYPTAFKIAAIYAYRELSDSIAKLQNSLQSKEQEFAGILTIGRTEMQDAVPITLGSQFGAFADAIARDRWRTFKCEERLRMVNIGGTAVGTGLAAPRKYIFAVIEKLRAMTGLGLSRAENVMDGTSNLDSIVESMGMLVANAVNLQKIALDLRLMHYQEEIELLGMQAGSSIMPGKINPVIIEATVSVAMKIKSNAVLINDACALGTLQINEYFPLIAFTMLESIDLLTNINSIFAQHITGIKANPDICRKHFEESIIIITAFLPYIGYEKAEELLNEYKFNHQGTNVRNYLANKLGENLTNKVLSSANLMSLGHK